MGLALTTVDALRARLLAVDWSVHYTDSREQAETMVALFCEYLRRAAIIAAAMPSGVPSSWPFFDVAARIGPEVRAPADVVAEVSAVVPRNRMYVGATCLYALHFAQAHDIGLLPDSILDPFAPLVYMYEVGGPFTRGGDGMIEFGVAAVGAGTAQRRLTRPVSPKLPDFPDLAGNPRAPAEVTRQGRGRR